MKGAVVMYGINNAANLDLTGRVSEFAYQYVYGSIRNNSSKVDKVLGQLNLTYRKGKSKNDIDFIFKSAHQRCGNNDPMMIAVKRLSTDVLKSLR